MLKVGYLVLLLPFYANAKDQYAWQWAQDDGFNTAYQRVLQNISTETWIKTVRGPSTKSREITLRQPVTDTMKAKEIAHNRQLTVNYISWCKAHDCAEHNISVFYQAEMKKVYGLIVADKTYFIGDPPVYIQQGLVALHKEKYQYSKLISNM